MALSIPPLDDSPVFTQIPLARDLIPLDDLGAAGGYGRQLIIPDDIPPTLALPWALGPKLPRVNRAEDNGSLHVFVTNGSSVGGASNWKATETGSSTGTGVAGAGTVVLFTTTGSGGAILRHLYLGYYVDPATAPATGVGSLDIGITSFTAGTRVARIASIPVAFSNAAGDHYGLTGAVEIDFSPGLDMAATVPDPANSYQLYCNRNMPAGVFVTYSYVLSTT